MTRRARGIGLLSGGLDSALACVVLRDAGADVECLHFFTGFCVTAHNSAVGRRNRPTANRALRVAAEIGVPLELVDISGEYLPMVLKPKHGYGRNMNPCIDCRVLMLRKARDHMEARGADFVFTGEVIGQRPKSQVKVALRAIEKEAGLEGRLLRPLSAKLLTPTEIERAGLVDREKLHGFAGRGRKGQIELAGRYGIKTHMQPAGGCCFLTDPAYSRKLKDAVAHQAGACLTVEDVFVLAVGRHFRFSPDLRVVIGRDEAENGFLARHAEGRWLAAAIGFTGPSAMVLGEVNGSQWASIASVVARYSDGKDEASVEVEFVRGRDLKRVVTAPASREFIEAHRI
jgi:tRNA-specific 2-thiouridylase